MCLFGKTFHKCERELNLLNNKKALKEDLGSIGEEEGFLNFISNFYALNLLI